MEKDMLAGIIGENVGKYRSEAGLTQAQLAERVGVGTAFISRVERGQKMMKICTLYAMADALHVSCDALLYRHTAVTQVENIGRLLAGRSDAFAEDIERLVRLCAEAFEHRGDAHPEHG